MSRFWYGLYVVAVAVLTGVLIRVLIAHPPHAAPPAAEVTAPLPLAAVGGEHPGQVIDRFAAFVEVVRAQEARVEAARRVAVPRVAPDGALPDCFGLPMWFPHWIAWRESHCTRGIDSGNGYRGWAQVADMHWFGGACDGLSWTIPEEEDECVDRLSQHGTRLAPWGA